MKCQLTRQQWTQAVAARQAGTPTAVIAGRFGAAPGSLAYLFSRAGITPPQPLTRDEADTAATMRRAGRTTAEIQAAMPRHTVAHIEAWFAEGRRKAAVKSRREDALRKKLAAPAVEIVRRRCLYCRRPFEGPRTFFRCVAHRGMGE